MPIDPDKTEDSRSASGDKRRVRRRDGSVLSIKAKPRETISPLGVPGVDTQATTADVLDAVDASRERK